MKHEIIPAARIAQSMHLLRGQQVMLDRDLAALYGVETRILNQAVKRNEDRFPEDFAFTLTREEIGRISQIVTSSSGLKFSKQVRAFTEQGVAMLSSVLKSERAVKVNIAIMRAFVNLREALETSRELARRFSDLEKRVGERTRLAGWRGRPPHRESFPGRGVSARSLHVRRSFSARRRKQHARRVCSPIRTK